VSYLSEATPLHTDKDRKGQSIPALIALHLGDDLLSQKRGGRMYVYPEKPGSKGPDGTSQSAANNLALQVNGMRRKVLEALRDQGCATVLELVERTGMERYSVQPRVSELRAMGLVESSGERRKNPSGQGAAVQRLTDKGRASL
jgi:DNA-binding transcriptional ArsR family regulator